MAENIPKNIFPEPLAGWVDHMIANADIAVFVSDLDGKLHYANPGMARAFGYDSMEELLQLNAVELYSDPDERAEILTKLLSEGRVTNFKVHIDNPNGNADTILLSAMVKDEHIIGFAIDISDQEKAEKDLKSAMERVSMLHGIDQALLGARSLSEIIRAAIQQLRQMVPLDRISVAHFDQERGLAYVLAVDAEVETEIRDGFEFPLEMFKVQEPVTRGETFFLEDLKTLDSQSPVTKKLIEEGIIETANVPIMNEGILLGTLNLGSKNKGFITESMIKLSEMVADSLAVAITSRRAQEQLVRSEEKYRQIVERSYDGIIVVEDAKVRFANKAFERITGYPNDELIDKDFSFLISPDNLEYVLKKYANFIEGRQDSVNIQFKGLHRTGTEVDVEIDASVTDHEGKRAMLVFVRDVSERNQAETALTIYREHLEEMVEERTSDMETFAYSVSHDLRSPLRAMQGFAQLLKEEYKDSLGEQGVDYTERIMEAALRLDALTNDLLDFSRISQEEFTLETIPLEDAVTESLKDLERIIGDCCGNVIISEGLPSVQGNKIMLVQAITNLVSNALKFVPEDVQPVVRIYHEMDGDTVRFCVKDNGIGVEPEHMRKIFKLFERLHGRDKYPGTGLGLAIVRKSIERMGGSVGMENDPVGGSIFYFELPGAAIEEPDRVPGISDRYPPLP